MATMTVMPRGVGEWSVDDLDALPDDGLQYELLDGMLLVTPAPTPAHQRAVLRMAVLLDASRSSGCEVLTAPIDWRPDGGTSLQPDLLVLNSKDYDERRVPTSLLLVVEVLSPSTRRKDRLLKRAAYEEAGVGSYWMVDPAEPSVLALELVDGRYAVVGEAHGDEPLQLERPFRVTVVPAALLRA